MSQGAEGGLKVLVVGDVHISDVLAEKLHALVLSHPDGGLVLCSLDETEGAVADDVVAEVVDVGDDGVLDLVEGPLLPPGGGSQGSRGEGQESESLDLDHSCSFFSGVPFVVSE